MSDLPRGVFECDSLRILTLKRSFIYQPKAPRNADPLLRFSSSYIRAISGLRKLHTLSLTDVDFSDKKVNLKTMILLKNMSFQIVTLRSKNLFDILYHSYCVRKGLTSNISVQIVELSLKRFANSSLLFKVSLYWLKSFKLPSLYCS